MAAPSSYRDPPPPTHESAELIASLRHVLADLHAHPYAELPSPENLPRRASVALIIRIQPHYSHWPSAPSEIRALYDKNARGETTSASNEDRLEEFFSQDWVKHGDPEILFIKRAARKGDKWTSHVAFPGGRRDPEDQDDRAAAVRETSEEVGLDLSEHVSLSLGNLPQKVVTMAWGKTPLMVLCPYIFLLTTPIIPPLRLQPTEVASAHWVPIRALLSPRQRTLWYQDVSSRTSRQELGMRRWFHRFMTGKMMFAAVRLIPSESSYCTSIAEFMPHDSTARPASTEVSGRRKEQQSCNHTVPLIGASWNPAPSPVDTPLLLWGLTLGVVSDFLDFLPTQEGMRLWVYPTFTPYDLRFILWLMSCNFRRKKQIAWEQGYRTSTPPAVELGMDSIAMRDDSSDSDGAEASSGSKLEGKSRSRWESRDEIDRRGLRSQLVNVMLEGYYKIIRRAVVLTVVMRLSVLVGGLYLGWKRWRAR